MSQNKNGAEQAPFFIHFSFNVALWRGVGELAPLAVRIVGAAVHRQHDYLGTDVDPRIEIGNVFVGEADATGRNLGADHQVGRLRPKRAKLRHGLWRGRCAQ